jgi:hypothetical protein
MGLKRTKKGTFDAGKCSVQNDSKDMMLADEKCLGQILHEQKPRKNAQYAKYYSQAITIIRKLSSESKFFED